MYIYLTIYNLRDVCTYFPSNYYLLCLLKSYFQNTLSLGEGRRIFIWMLEIHMFTFYPCRIS